MMGLFQIHFRRQRANQPGHLLAFAYCLWRAGLLPLTAASLAAPLFVVTIVVIFLPWLIWGFPIHTERLHDRDKRAWLVTIYLVPGMLGHFAKTAWFAGVIGTAPQPILALAALA